jgi:hypothetical protein
MFELLGLSWVGNLAQPPEQYRQHSAHDRKQPADRLGACCALLFGALETGFAVGWAGGGLRDQPGFTLLAAQLALLAFFFLVRALISSRPGRWLGLLIARLCL